MFEISKPPTSVQIQISGTKKLELKRNYVLIILTILQVSSNAIIRDQQENKDLSSNPKTAKCAEPHRHELGILKIANLKLKDENKRDRNYQNQYRLNFPAQQTGNANVLVIVAIPNYHHTKFKNNQEENILIQIILKFLKTPTIRRVAQFANLNLK